MAATKIYLKKLSSVVFGWKCLHLTIFKKIIYWKWYPKWNTYLFKKIDGILLVSCLTKCNFDGNKFVMEIILVL